jgi:hypothetical protein
VLPGCVDFTITPGTLNNIGLSPGDYIYTENGTANIDGQDDTYIIDGNGLIWSESEGFYNATVGQITDSRSYLRLILCSGGDPRPTPTLTNPGCVGTEYAVPAAPASLVLTFTVDLRFVIYDKPINFASISEPGSIELPPGSFRWGVNPAPGPYELSGVGGAARIWICQFETTPTIAISTSTPGGTGPGGEPGTVACIPPATAPPSDAGAMPDLALVIPTFGALPTVITATATISSSVLFTQTDRIVTAVVGPAQTVTAWCAVTFGGGWNKAQTDVAPITADLPQAFGWLKIFERIGPLAWLTLPLILTFLIRVALAVMSAVKYIKQIIPFQ